MAENIPSTIENPTISDIKQGGGYVIPDLLPMLANEADTFSSLPETPRSHRSHAGKADITVLRPIIAVEMDREFVRLPVDSFMKEYMPFVPSEDVIERVIQQLSDASYQSSPGDESSDEESDQEPIYAALRAGTSLMLHHDNRLMFRDFPQPPTQTNGSEKVVYAPLAKIADQISQIQDLIPERQRNEYHYRDVSSKKIQSDIKGSNNKIDACFMSGAKNSLPATHDIAVVIEQKLVLEQRGGNNRQAVSANVQIMNDDVRRMFTFGITIESDKATVWYHSRSHSAISEQFSFVHKPKLLLKVFTSFLYATTEELGYDPLVEYLGKGHYLFKDIPNVQDSSVLDTYKSINTISEIRANNITGRMARVFTVVKYDADTEDFGTTRYVLKDLWLDKDAQTERQLQKAIFYDIEAFWNKDKTPPELDSLKEAHHDLVISTKDYKKHFLSIASDYHGRISKPLASEFEPIRGLLAGPALEDEETKPGSDDARRAIHTSKTSHSVPLTTEIAYADFAREDFVRTYASRRQYRVVFNEVCTTVGHLDTLGEVLDVLHQSLIPLQMMFCAGWVHRDISSGNIMAYRKVLRNNNEPWTAILADLEYAKKYPPPPGNEAASDPKTGTPFFMPIEIMMQTTLFEKDHDESQGIINANTPEADSTKKDPNVPATSAPQKKKILSAYKLNLQRLKKNQSLDIASNGIVHNFQHDLESVWWIILWTITCRVAGNPAQLFGQQIFHNSIRVSPARGLAFRKPIQVKLEQCLGPLATTFPIRMESIRMAMYQAYVAREREGKLREVASFAAIHQSFEEFLEDLAENNQTWATTLLGAKNPYIDQAERKRPHPDDDDNDEAGEGEEGEEHRSKVARITDSDQVEKLVG
ncbi:hypothetical protein CVT25_005073 [Psilocybe cyanescens]|uniref:Fungal-type protein kinase domain-containing protein n=1 Tax=Psilocybe cyanescens TaxID=93625 RepID=A0A409XE20_PSICY|nr:hypothetical protein CVT25_005073 [Psilocybe cyanescens]